MAECVQMTVSVSTRRAASHVYVSKALPGMDSNVKVCLKLNYYLVQIILFAQTLALVWEEFGLGLLMLDK